VVQEVPCHGLILLLCRASLRFRLELVGRSATDQLRRRSPFYYGTCRSVVDHSAAVAQKEEEDLGHHTRCETEDMIWTQNPYCRI
jgi:hypothetical protein